MLWAFDPVKYCIAAPRLSARHEPQVGLDAAAEQHARLGVAAAEHPLDEPVPDERGPSAPGPPPIGEHVEVAAGLAAAAQAADRDEVDAGRLLAEVADDRGGDVGGLGEQVTPGVTAPLVDAP